MEMLNSSVSDVRIIRKLLTPFEEFAANQAFGGLLLALAAADDYRRHGNMPKAITSWFDASTPDSKR